MKTVMVVDDEFIVRVGFKSILNWEECGYSFTCEASNGREAIDKIRKFQPDVVLTDLKMDVMDGFELISLCKKEFPAIAIIVLSSYNDFENVKRAMKLGADDYIFKLTVNPEELLNILDEVSSKYNMNKPPIPQTAEKDMNQFVRKNVVTLKRNFMKDAVRGYYYDEKDFIEEFSKVLCLKVNLFQTYTVLYFSIDNYESLKKVETEENILKFSLQNIIQEIVEKEYTAESFDYDMGDLILIIQQKENDAEICDHLNKLFETIALYVKRYMGIGISAYASQECMGLTSLQEVVDCIQRRNYKRLPSEHGKLNFYMEDVREEITSIEQYVKNNLSEDLSVAAVARVANMSESYFSHIFKKEMGQSFTNYVNHIRIHKAKELMKRSDLKMNEIALEVGLENANYFSTLFKKVTGQTPSQFKDSTNML